MQPASDRPNYLMGALAGGALAGILSVIPLVNCCCFLWGIAGGALAAFVSAQRAQQFGAPEGLLAGAAAGGVGTAILGIISGAFAILQMILLSGRRPPMPALPPNAPPVAVKFAQWMHEAGPIAGAVVQTVFMLFVLVIFAAIGGLIYGLIFKKEDFGPGDVYDVQAQPPKGDEYQ